MLCVVGSGDTVKAAQAEAYRVAGVPAPAGSRVAPAPVAVATH